MQPVVVRRVTISDAVAVAQLRHTALHDTPYAFAMSPAQLAHPTHHSWSELCARCSSGTNSIFVADTGHALAGMVGCRIDESSKMHHCGMIWGMYVTDTHRRLGIAYMLLDAVITHGATQHLQMLKLSVTVRQQTAVRLYQRTGFMTYAYEPALLNIDNQEIDALHMVYLYHVEGTQQ